MRLAIDLHDGAINILQQQRERIGQLLDNPGGQRIFRRQANPLAHGALRPVAVAAAQLRQAANIGNRVIDHFAFHGRATCTIG